jgi:hypothetical protein
MDGQAVLVQGNPYAEPQVAKSRRMLEQMNELTAFHAENCIQYRRILEAAFGGLRTFDALNELPALPVRLFKEMELFSVPRDTIVKTLTSSGTTGQRPSQILLDKETASSQAHALVRIMRSYLGKDRWPMLLIDHSAVLKNRNSFSARGAGILGFSQFGTDQTYALQDETLQPDWHVIEAFLERHKGQKIFLFGFTFVIWQHLLRVAEESGRKLDFGESVLIHGGGWKNLEGQNISNEEFKKRLRESFGIRSIYNYYGMVEQTGSIHMECEAGYLHASDCSEVLMRDPRTLKECSLGEPGLVETMSALPRSYPGHILLTEDMGIVHGDDGCKCNRRGVHFKILGRLPNAELRGCSDTYRAGA